MIFGWFSSYSQSTQPGDSCNLAMPFCTDSSFKFPAGVNSGQGEVGPNYGCLVSTPNPAWFFLRIGVSGDIKIHMKHSNNKDIDFICWGPFNSQATPCDPPYSLLSGNCHGHGYSCTTTTECPNNTACPYPQFYPSGNIVDCSFDPIYEEDCYIPNAQYGQFYLFLITNYSNQPGFIEFSKVFGTGETDCGIIAPPVVGDTVCENDDAHLRVTIPKPGAIYHWTGPNNFTSNDTNPVIHHALLSNTGWYYLRIQIDSTISKPDSCYLLVKQRPNVSVTLAHNKICAGDTATLSASGADNYLWNNGLQHLNPVTITIYQSTTYIVTGTTNGCSDTASIKLIVSGGKFIGNASQYNPVNCYDGKDGTAIANFTSISPPYRYQWSSNPIQTTQVANNLSAGIYYVTVTDTGSCFIIDTVTISQPTDIIISVTPKNETCENACDGSIQVDANGGIPPYHYSWHPSYVGHNNIVTNLCAGDYTVTIYDAHNCPKVEEEKIESDVILRPNFTSFPNPCVTNFPVQFTFTGTYKGPTPIFNWNFGDGTNSNQENPTHTYTTDGLYNVVLTIKNATSSSCDASYMISINIIVPSKVEIPNVFSPNGNGYNDVFRVKSEGLETEKMEIFNRWGQKIYTWQGVNGFWDGRSNSGKLMPEGTYYWIFEARGYDGKDYHSQGSVFIVR